MTIPLVRPEARAPLQEDALAGTSASVSVIVPTIGRPESLRQLLESLAIQSVPVGEVIVADGSDTDGTAAVTGDPEWADKGLVVRRIITHPPNAVRQRQAAIGQATGAWLLLLDDDVVLERDCLEELLVTARGRPGVSAVMATFNNQPWPKPQRVWRWYLALMYGIRGGEWQGRVIGPLLRFGFEADCTGPRKVEWIGTCNSLVSRAAYERAGGFSEFFLYRCTMNEDVDLGLKLSRVGPLLFCPQARMAHNHAPGGRVRAAQVAEDDLYNRYLILRKTVGRSGASSFASVAGFFTIETSANMVGGALRGRLRHVWPLLIGRLRALRRIVGSLAR